MRAPGCASDPELVAYGPDGKVIRVRYSRLSALLLNELQKRTREIDRLSAQMAAMKANHEQELRDVMERLSSVKQAMHTGTGDGGLAAATRIDR